MTSPPLPLAGYTAVDELIVTPPLIVAPEVSVTELARQMTASGSPYAAVRTQDGRYGVVSDADIRRVVAADRVRGSTAADVMTSDPPIVILGDSAAAALLLLLDRNAEIVLVTDRAGTVRGAVSPRDFMVSSATAGITMHEQVRRAGSIDELTRRARRLPSVVDDLLGRGLAPGQVILVHSAIIDTVVRRAIGLVFDARPELDRNAFTWLSLGSNGRREAVLSSDVDSAAALDERVAAEPEVSAYRAAFAEVIAVLDAAGLSHDGHGTTAANAQFSCSNASWRAAAREWMATPEKNNGAIMASLLVDGRPIHGDSGLTEVNRVFHELRQHPGTMRLLLRHSLSERAQPHPLRSAMGWRPDVVDIKKQGVLPVVNIARWAALSVGSSALPTVDRLRDAAGTEMLPDDNARVLVEVFQVLQRLRLRYQLRQREAGEAPTDKLLRGHLTPIDRSVVSQALREIAAVQRRMDNIGAYVPIDEWAAPQP